MSYIEGIDYPKFGNDIIKDVSNLQEVKVYDASRNVDGKRNQCIDNSLLLRDYAGQDEMVVVRGYIGPKDAKLFIQHYWCYSRLDKKYYEATPGISQQKYAYYLVE